MKRRGVGRISSRLFSILCVWYAVPAVIDCIIKQAMARQLMLIYESLISDLTFFSERFMIRTTHLTICIFLWRICRVYLEAGVKNRRRSGGMIPCMPAGKGKEEQYFSL